MTDLYTLLKQSVARFLAGQAGVPIVPRQIECPAPSRRQESGQAARGANEPPYCAMRSAAPLAFGADPAAWIDALRPAMGEERLLGVPYLREVRHNGGHLLFFLTDDFYTQALRLALQELPPAPHAGDTWHEDAALARILYTRRRMWMLARKAQGACICPPLPAVQKALFLSLAITERPDEDTRSGDASGRDAPGRGVLPARAMELRLLEASDALLTMTHCVPPGQRAALLRRCGYVGEAASRLYALGCDAVVTPATKEIGEE